MKQMTAERLGGLFHSMQASSFNHARFIASWQLCSSTRGIHPEHLQMKQLFVGLTAVYRSIECPKSPLL